MWSIQIINVLFAFCLFKKKKKVGQLMFQIKPVWFTTAHLYVSLDHSFSSINTFPSIIMWKLYFQLCGILETKGRKNINQASLTSVNAMIWWFYETFCVVFFIAINIQEYKVSEIGKGCNDWQSINRIFHTKKSINKKNWQFKHCRIPLQFLPFF